MSEQVALARMPEPMPTVADIGAMVRMIAGGAIAKKKAQSEQDVALILLSARELGLPPVASLQHMHVIEGALSMSPHLLLALVARSDGHLDIQEGDGFCEVVAQRPNGLVRSYTCRWDRIRAKAAGLTGKTNWQRYERNMLRARAIGETCRLVWPDVVLGIYCEGEIIGGGDVIEGTAVAVDLPCGKPAEEFLDEHPPEPVIGAEGEARLQSLVRQAVEDGLSVERRTAFSKEHTKRFGKDLAAWTPEQESEFAADLAALVAEAQAARARAELLSGEPPAEDRVAEAELAGLEA